MRKYILSPLLKENEGKDEVSKEIEKYMGDQKNELSDEKLYELVEKEYFEIFHKYNQEQNEDKKEEENQEENKDEEKAKVEKIEEENKEPNDPEYSEYKKCIDKFIADFPFKIYIRKDSSGYYYNREAITLINSRHFPSFNKKLKEFFEIKSFATPLIESNFRSTNYELIVKFNPESKYINKDTFNLNHYDSIAFDYKPKKKEEPKKEGEEEDDGKMTLQKKNNWKKKTNGIVPNAKGMF